MSRAVGRLMRHQRAETGPAEGRGSGWQPVGDPLPPFAHAPPAPQLLLAPWVLPKELEPRPYDILVVGELAHQLITRCEQDDPLYIELAEQTLMFTERTEALAWLAEIEVWVGRRLDPGRDWPEPPN